MGPTSIEEANITQSGGHFIAHGETTMLKPRAYQQEMLAEALRQNTIVAMDTGSGKTEIAILRIRAELERCAQDKIVWFLAPTITLAEQQHTVISYQLPAFQTRLLSGADNVDHWSTQQVWDSILLNIHIVVSTPQVLLDARSRGFVKMCRIALLVFDEAHHCTSSHAMNGIMQKFYHPFRGSGNMSDLPCILGLTASPVTKANVGGLRKLEENLNAIVRTPTIHREELLQYVYQPEIATIIFERGGLDYSPLLRSLEMLIHNTLLSIENDPLIKRLRSKNDQRTERELAKVLISGKTPCQKELNRFLRSAMVTHEELGPWAADVFIAACLKRFYAGVSESSEDYMLVDWETDEKKYIARLLSQLNITEETRLWGSVQDILSGKANLLVETLAKSYAPGLRAIIFARERSKVVMLTHLLSVHPLMDNILPGHFVGSTGYASRKSSLSEFIHPRDQKDAIDDLRAGKKNVLVATSVLEEGIDVSACNLVICYDTPSDLKSFVQRRGRARMQNSKFVMFVEQKDGQAGARWSMMEQVMKEMYSDTTRLLAEIQETENVEEDGQEAFRITSTDALLDYHNARPYLEHFCSTISCSYTENRPEFIMKHDGNEGLLSAKVILPSFLDPTLREISGKRLWMTEKMAKRDAAFQAYFALYRAGLVNDNLMPKHCEGQLDATEPVERRPNIAQASARFNPWVEVAMLWTTTPPALFQTQIKFSPQAFGLPSLIIVTPVPLPSELSFKLFWNQEVTVAVSLKSKGSTLPTALIQSATDATYLLLSSVFSGRMQTDRTDFPALFLPKLPSLLNSIGPWLASVRGTVMAQEIEEIRDPDAFQKLGLARNDERYARPFTMEETLWKVPHYGENEADVEEQEQLHIQGTVLPKRTDFLHPVATGAAGALHHTSKQCVLARACSIDRLPAMYARAALFIPSIIHKIEVLLLAQRLTRTILASVGFNELALVTAAISASAAREEMDYQRLEFLGDSILKFNTSVQLTAKNGLWHEGLLSAEKDKLVSNARLSRAALEIGLDAYILTRAFTGIKWRPSYVSDLIEPIPNINKTNKRELSTKVLADVVEALIGAAYIDGGMDKAIQCLRVFLPNFDWLALDQRINQLYDVVQASDDLNPLSYMQKLECLIGYTFTKKTLLMEALTHPCSRDHNMSYQRMEFLGDSVLDHIVTHSLFHFPEEIPHYEMHLMRTALVNADFLAFLCLGASIDEVRQEPTEQGKAHLSTTETIRKVYLWQFMRHSASSEIRTAQQNASKRYEELRDQIQEALYNSTTYPWALLSRLEAGKFFSDLVESLLGAIFVDSHGSLETCQQFLEKIGLSSYMRRILSVKTQLLHPKECLGHAARSSRVQYNTRQEKETDDENGKRRKWVCSIRVGDEDIVELTDGVNPIEIETRTAAAATDILTNRRNTACQRQDD